MTARKNYGDNFDKKLNETKAIIGCDAFSKVLDWESELFWNNSNWSFGAAAIRIVPQSWRVRRNFRHFPSRRIPSPVLQELWPSSEHRVVVVDVRAGEIPDFQHAARNVPADIREEESWIWQNLSGGIIQLNENSHSEYWENLGTSVTEKSRKHLKRASVFAIYVRTAKQILVL